MYWYCFEKIDVCHSWEDWWIKQCHFPRGWTSYKICQCKKSQVMSLFIQDNRKWRTLIYPKVDNCTKLWVKVFIVTFLDAPVTVDVLTASSKSCWNSNCTFCMTIKSSSCLDRINLTPITHIGKFQGSIFTLVQSFQTRTTTISHGQLRQLQKLPFGWVKFCSTTKSFLKFLYDNFTST